MKDQRVVLGVDRLDYTKGLFSIYSQYLLVYLVFDIFLYLMF